MGLAEAADIDGERLVAGDGEFPEGEAQMPCCFEVEGGEYEELFLPGDDG